jgi:hypothetical protein
MASVRAKVFKVLWPLSGMASEPLPEWNAAEDSKNSPAIRKRDPPQTPEEALARWKTLGSHLISESLGYMTPKVAGMALKAYANDEVFGCEWYSHISQCRGKDMFDQAEYKKINRDVIEPAFLNRAKHKGYMADYQQAKALVDEFVGTGRQPDLASWF